MNTNLDIDPVNVLPDTLYKIYVIWYLNYYLKAYVNCALCSPAFNF